MAARFDFHIHTKYLGCANETMEVEPVVREFERLGAERIGFADHLNRPEQLAEHKPILADIRRLETELPVYFGAELNFTGEGEGFVFDEQIKADYGFQFAIAGVHETYLADWDQAKAVESHHRHHLLACEHPLVDVLVHPWWWQPHEFRTKEWGDFPSAAVVPEKLTRELAQVARQTNTAIEINAGANLVRRPEGHYEAYVDYLAILAGEGVTFSLASDAHNIGQVPDIQAVWDVVDRLGLSDDRIWRPGCGPIVPGSAPAAPAP